MDAHEKFFYYFENSTKYNDNKSILDIGTTPSLDSEKNIILEKTKNNKNITCLSDQDCRILEKKYQNIKSFVIGDSLRTDYKDISFDIVHSNATIEHVGSLESQIAFIQEDLKVAKKICFYSNPK